MGANFHVKSKKVLKINFLGSNQSRGVHCTSDDIIDTRTRDLLCY